MHSKLQIQLSDSLPAGAVAEITAEHIRQIYRQGPVLSIGAVAGASIVTLMGITIGGNVLLHICWWLAVVASAAVRLWLFRQYAAELELYDSHNDSHDDSLKDNHLIAAKPAQSSSIWGLRFALVTLLAGMVWGSWPFWFHASTGVEYLLVVSVMIAAMVAVLANSASVYLPAFYCFALPVGLPLIVFHLLSGQDALVWTGWLLLLFIVVNYVLAVRGFRQYRDLFETRFRNSLLLEQLAGEKQTAELAVIDKNRFIAAASHDLRQPLHAINLLLAALGRSKPNRRQQLILEDINQSSRTLNQHFNAILDISCMESGAIDSHISCIDLNDLCNNVVAEFTPAASAKDLSLTYVPPNQSVKLHSDRLLLERILGNLLSNAIKFTGKGFITVSSAINAQGGLLVRIQDTGIGIEASQIDRVFDEYQRCSSVSQGVGLGLSIVDRLCRQLDIAISVVSNPGDGTCFMLAFPATQLEHVDNEITSDARCRRTQVGIGIDESSFFTIETGLDVDTCSEDESEFVDTNDRNGAQALAGYHVLIIDDDTDVLNATCGLLQQFGAQVTGATSVQKAIAEFARSDELSAPNLLLCDYRLQAGVIAFDAIAALQEFFECELPACIITADRSPHELLRIKASGVPLLHKPIDSEMLINRLLEYAR